MAASVTSPAGDSPLTVIWTGVSNGASAGPAFRRTCGAPADPPLHPSPSRRKRPLARRSANATRAHPPASHPKPVASYGCEATDKAEPRHRLRPRALSQA